MYRFSVDSELNVLYLVLRGSLDSKSQQEAMRDLYRLIDEELLPGAIVVSDFERAGSHVATTYDRVAVDICAEKAELGVRIVPGLPHPADKQARYLDDIPYPMLEARDIEAAEALIRSYRANASPYLPDRE